MRIKSSKQLPCNYQRGMIIASCVACPLAVSVDRQCGIQISQVRYNKQRMVSVKYYYLFIVLYIVTKKKKKKKKKNTKTKKKKQKQKAQKKKKKNDTFSACIYFSCIMLAGLRCPLHKTPSCKKDQGLPLTSTIIECRHFNINQK